MSIPSHRPLLEIWTGIRQNSGMEEEMLPIVDDIGVVIDCAPRSECHKGPGRLHPVVHLHVFSSDGMIYLQKRADTKKVYPGRWDTAIGGHIDLGEELMAALRREAFEELGIAGFLPGYIGALRVDTPVESEYVHIFVTTHDGPFRLEAEEISDGRFWEQDEIERNLGSGLFTPNFEEDFSALKEYQRMYGD